MSEPCAICGRPSVHTHHRKLRSQLGDDSEANLIRVCLSHHNAIHNSPKQSYEKGWMVHSWDNPATVPVLTEGFEPAGQGVGLPAFESHPVGPSVSPGEKCPSCDRRIPLPKKPSSPTTKVASYRIPIDDAETHNEAIEAWAEHWGLLQKPHWKFWLLNYACAEALAGPKKDMG